MSRGGHDRGLGRVPARTETPHPGPVEDCYAGLVWVSDHAEELNIDPNASSSVGRAPAVTSRQASL
ncbi:hypothetical protein GCM10023198_46660 [Promicromonospora umidemergens]|uniref:Uncharacterized protein n=1 Tax=Promicromonospora umidemergens TaxID=629679 RepID=A0ABP8Y0Z8_9MICO